MITLKNNMNYFQNNLNMKDHKITDQNKISLNKSKLQLRQNYNCDKISIFIFDFNCTIPAGSGFKSGESSK